MTMLHYLFYWHRTIIANNSVKWCKRMPFRHLWSMAQSVPPPQMVTLLGKSIHCQRYETPMYLSTFTTAYSPHGSSFTSVTEIVNFTILQSATVVTVYFTVDARKVRLRNWGCISLAYCRYIQNCLSADKADRLQYLRSLIAHHYQCITC